MSKIFTVFTICLTVIVVLVCVKTKAFAAEYSIAQKYQEYRVLPQVIIFQRVLTTKDK